MAMHPTTQALLLAAIRAELQADPTQRGYAGKSAGQITALLNMPIITAHPPAYRDVLISDVEGYLSARLLLVGLEDWIAGAEAGIARQAARQFLGIIQGGRLLVFLTSDAAPRANILGLFATLCQAGAGGLTMDHYADLAAMTLAPAAPPVESAPRWSLLIDGMSGEEGFAGPPNAAAEALVEEAING